MLHPFQAGVAEARFGNLEGFLAGMEFVTLRADPVLARMPLAVVNGGSIRKPARKTDVKAKGLIANRDRFVVLDHDPAPIVRGILPGQQTPGRHNVAGPAGAIAPAGKLIKRLNQVDRGRISRFV
jgi:hypothetical protein